MTEARTIPKKRMKIEVDYPKPRYPIPNYPKSMFELNDFGGGLNTNYPLLSLADNESPNLQNMLFDRFGNMYKVKGIAKVNTVEIATSEGVYGLLPYYKSSDGTKQLLCMCNTDLWKLTGTTWGRIKSSLVAHEYIQGTTFMDLLIIVKKSNATMKWDGSNITALGGGSPTGQYICNKVHRVFIAGNTTYPTRLYFSDAGDYTTWDVNGYLDIFPLKGDVITGIQSVLEGIVIYTEHCVYMLFTRDSSDPNAWMVKRIAEFYGNYAPYSLVKVPTKANTIYLYEDGVYTVEGTLNMGYGLISDKITNYIKSISLANRQKGWGLSFDFKYWLIFPDNKILVYDYVLNSWSRIIGINARCGTAFKKDATTAEKLYLGSATNGYVYIYGDNDDFDGSVIDAWYITKPFETEHKLNQKEYWTSNLIVENQSSDYNISLGYKIDFASAFTTKNISVYDADSNKILLIRPMNMKSDRGRFIQYEIKNSNANQYFKVHSLFTELTVKKYNKGK